MTCEHKVVVRFAGGYAHAQFYTACDGGKYAYNGTLTFHERVWDVSVMPLLSPHCWIECTETEQ